MTTLREAAQQALEALEKSVAAMRGLYGGWRCESALKQADTQIAALSAALAQEQAEPEVEMPSNTRFTVHVEGHGNTYYDCIHDAMTYAQRSVYASVDATTRAIDDLKAGRIAEWSYGFSAVRIYPPQKMVAQLAPPRCPNCASLEAQNTELDRKLAEPVARFDERLGHPTLLPDAPLLEADQLLYTAPPQRKPLTEEEIDTLWRAPMSADWEHREFARAIEQAHGIIESEIEEDKA